jgi:hypothetical protein
MAYYAQTTTGDGRVWCYWTSTQTSATTATVWENWNGSTDTATITSTSTTQTWTAWNGTHFIVNAPQRARTKEEQRLWDEEQAERQRQAEERQRKQREAEQRAEELLCGNLTPDQLAEYRRSKFFVVRGNKTGKKYKVNCDRGFTGNVHELDEKGAVARRLCAHIRGDMLAPKGDHFLAQKLALQHDEESFLQVANFS